jgi:hypothetical protein
VSSYAWTAALQTVKRNCDMLFVRGDGVVLVRVVSLLASLSCVGLAHPYDGFRGGLVRVDDVDCLFDFAEDHVHMT